jgi:predicted nicotinamide N-methyase
MSRTAAVPAFIKANTALGRAALVPEIQLQLATEITPIWQATETWLEREGLSPPFWAFAWPGSQALARHILDRPALVAGRRVLDFAAGGGLAAIACALAGASTVEAAEIDPLAADAIRLNAAHNRVEIAVTARDVVGEPGRWDLILCGDVCYEAPMTEHIVPWLERLARTAEVWIADPGRRYLPATGLEHIATYDVLTSLELEDRPVRTTRLLRLRPG